MSLQAMTLTAAAGIDAGKAFLDVAFAPNTTTFRVDNSASGIKIILTRLKRAGITLDFPGKSGGLF